MTIKEELDSKLTQLEEIFKKEISIFHRKIIDGSPVDSGQFKTAWKVDELDTKKLRFSLSNNKKYGMKLWRYKASKQGWSATGGDVLVTELERNLKDGFDSI